MAPRHCSLRSMCSTAPSSVATCNAHRHQEFIRFLNTHRGTGASRQGRSCPFSITTRLTSIPRFRAWLDRQRAVHVPLHPDIVFLAECCGGLLRQTVKAATKARRLPIRRRSTGRNQPLRRKRPMPNLSPSWWTADPNKIIAAVKTWPSNVRFDLRGAGVDPKRT